MQTPAAVRIGDSERGIASWYGHPYHGRRAANGEIYDMEKMTAAHRTLPFNTWVAVENLTNGKAAKVRITDRGPFVEGRVIDLSRAAAREIEMIGPGIAPVRLQIINAPADFVAPERYAVQIGAFRNRERADELRRALAERYDAVRLTSRQADGVIWRVLVGMERSLEAANKLAERLRPEYRAAFVVRVDEPDMEARRD